jgi:hypothetical protein
LACSSWLVDGAPVGVDGEQRVLGGEHVEVARHDPHDQVLLRGLADGLGARDLFL